MGPRNSEHLCAIFNAAYPYRKLNGKKDQSGEVSLPGFDKGVGDVEEHEVDAVHAAETAATACARTIEIQSSRKAGAPAASEVI